MQETTVRLGVGYEIPLDFSSGPLLQSISKDKTIRLYFECGEEFPEEKLSAQLIDHELGEGSVEGLLSADSEKTWKEEVDRLRLGAPLRPTVTAHLDVVQFQECNLGQRVHPCLVRLQTQSPTEIIKSLQEGVRRFVSLGIPEEKIKMSGVLADWS